MKWMSIVVLSLAAAGIGCDEPTAVFRDPSGTGDTADSSAGVGGAPSTTAGVGAGADNSPGYESGSRLRARLFAAEDGAKQFAGWFDTELDKYCAITMAGDGVFRCLPTGLATVGYFSDPNCTTQVAYSPKGCSKPPYASRVVASATCTAAETHVHELGDEVLSAYTGTPGSCANVSSSVLPNFYVFAVGAEVSPATFVAATESIE